MNTDVKLTVPYTLKINGIPSSAGETLVPLKDILDVYEDLAATEVQDDELKEMFEEAVQEHFALAMELVVDGAAMGALLKQVREALAIRDTEQSLTHGA